MINIQLLWIKHSKFQRVEIKLLRCLECACTMKCTSLGAWLWRHRCFCVLKGQNQHYLTNKFDYYAHIVSISCIKLNLCNIFRFVHFSLGQFDRSVHSVAPNRTSASHKIQHVRSHATRRATVQFRAKRRDATRCDQNCHANAFMRRETVRCDAKRRDAQDRKTGFSRALTPQFS